MFHGCGCRSWQVVLRGFVGKKAIENGADDAKGENEGDDERDRDGGGDGEDGADGSPPKAIMDSTSSEPNATPRKSKVVGTSQSSLDPEQTKDDEDGSSQGEAASRDGSSMADDTCKDGAFHSFLLPDTPRVMSVDVVAGEAVQDDSTVRSPRKSSVLDTDSGDEAAKDTRLLTNLQVGQNRSQPLDEGPMDEEQADSDDARSYSSDLEMKGVSDEAGEGKTDDNEASDDEAPAHKRSRVEDRVSEAT